MASSAATLAVSLGEGLSLVADELGVLLKDLDSAQRAFDAASQRFSQTRIEALSEQSDISLLNPAVAPLEPSSPRVLLNTLVAVLLGTILGVGLALLLELLNRPLRSSGDLKDMLGIPVLGTTYELGVTLAQLQSAARQVLVAALDASVARLGRERLGELVQR